MVLQIWQNSYWIWYYNSSIQKRLIRHLFSYLTVTCIYKATSWFTIIVSFFILNFSIPLWNSSNCTAPYDEFVRTNFFGFLEIYDFMSSIIVQHIMYNTSLSSLDIVRNLMLSQKYHGMHFRVSSLINYFPQCVWN